MKVLYIAPLIPAASGNGGKRAIYNHLMDVGKSAEAVDLFVVDVDGRGEDVEGLPLNFRPRVLPRGLPRGRGIVGLFAAIAQWIFDPSPRAAAVVSSKEARRIIADTLEHGRHDLVVVDHLNGWSLLVNQVVSVPILYIAHNVETNVLLDQRAYSKRSPLRWLRLGIEVAKMRRFECALLERADQVTVIAATDREAPMLQAVRTKVVLWPELPEIKPALWQPGSQYVLLFVGSAAYFPNADAIEWLVTEFMPAAVRLMPDLVLRIAGTAQADLPALNASANVIFEGFVSVERLDQLHRMSSAFICPVVLGSGIKIKVLEASSYGLPVVATGESLAGIGYLEGAALQIDRDADSAAREVMRLLRDGALLSGLSARALQQLAESRSSRRRLLEEAPDIRQTAAT